MPFESTDNTPPNSETAAVRYFEGKEKPPRLKLLLDLSPEEEATLKDRIADYNGRIKIFVHPYYRTNASDPETTRLQTALEKMIQRSPESTPPIVIFEDYTKTERLEVYRQAQQDIYVVFTGDNMGEVWCGEEQNARTLRRLEWDGKMQEAWTKVKNKFKELAVTSCVIAGIDLNFLIDRHDSTKRRSCVAQVANELREKMHIFVSDLTVGKVSIQTKEPDPKRKAYIYNTRNLSTLKSDRTPQGRQRWKSLRTIPKEED